MSEAIGWLIIKVTIRARLNFKAELSDAGMRLDSFLVARWAGHSRSQLSRLIKAGLVSCNGHVINKASYLMLGQELVDLVLPEPQASGIEAQDLPLEILFSDEHLALINKPVGLAVHPGAGLKDGTLCNALVHYFPDLKVGAVGRPGIIHRLDKDTSGVMLIAKTEQAMQALSADFKNRRINKFYRALCHGELAQTKFDLVTGHVRHPYNRLKFFTALAAPKSPSSSVRMAHSSFSVLQAGLGLSMLCVKLHTGRTHQIRAQLADIGHPLVGDKLYGGHRNYSKHLSHDLLAALDSFIGQALHAEIIEFTHPFSKQIMSFSAPLPRQFMIIEEGLRCT